MQDRILSFYWISCCCRTVGRLKGIGRSVGISGLDTEWKPHRLHPWPPPGPNLSHLPLNRSQDIWLNSRMVLRRTCPFCSIVATFTAHEFQVDSFRTTFLPCKAAVYHGTSALNYRFHWISDSQPRCRVEPRQTRCWRNSISTRTHDSSRPRRRCITPMSRGRGYFWKVCQSTKSVWGWSRVQWSQEGGKRKRRELWGLALTRGLRRGHHGWMSTFRDKNPEGSGVRKSLKRPLWQPNKASGTGRSLLWGEDGTGRSVQSQELVDWISSKVPNLKDHVEL